ncbi:MULTISPECIES: VanW family protein [unclassified Clostridium]|uniref:VanW family protein n=1 Tax=unclassified Clostridium TaxID=2614128 RepID=UPI00189A4EC6|nr:MULTISPECIES: VanW family protein [unclassified Clostridium]MCR1950102.1 VanW family protein [Clostridium sp. DSM 100503]
MSNNNLNTETPKEVVQTDKKSIVSILKSWKFILLVFLILVSILGYWIISSTKLINNYADKVYPGAYILNKDLAGLNNNDLHTTLISLVEDISNKKVNVEAKEQSFEISYKDLEATINYEELENEILSFGKNEGFFEKIKLLRKPENREYEFEVLFNDEKLTSFVSSISTAVDVSPINASIDISGGAINISNDSTGLKLNSADLIDKIKSQIKDMKAPNVVEVTGNVDVVEANIKASALSNVNNKISAFSTSYSAGPSGTNLQLAARNIDNIIVMPGETFSTEKAIGPTTIENGFVAANTYVNGQVVPGIGGGVCQVASTLYNTMLRAGIIPSERLNHMMKVSYVPIGLDATLADNLIDLKFVNNFEYPVVVNTYAGNGNLTIEFWSNESVKGGITYEPVSVPLGPLSADTYLYGYNSNGELVINEYLDRSTYQPLPN